MQPTRKGSITCSDAIIRWGPALGTLCCHPFQGSRGQQRCRPALILAKAVPTGAQDANRLIRLEPYNMRLKAGQGARMIIAQNQGTC
jgi:hypothetical protein